EVGVEVVRRHRGGPGAVGGTEGEYGALHAALVRLGEPQLHPVQCAGHAGITVMSMSSESMANWATSLGNRARFSPTASSTDWPNAASPSAMPLNAGGYRRRCRFCTSSTPGVVRASSITSE